jgi:hypothetical protein
VVLLSSCGGVGVAFFVGLPCTGFWLQVRCGGNLSVPNLDHMLPWVFDVSNLDNCVSGDIPPCVFMSRCAYRSN